MRIIVIGSGPAGLYSSLFLSSHAKVTVVEKAERLGGTCTVYGCMPAKSMLYLLHLAEDAAKFAKRFSLSQEEVRRSAKEAVNRLSKGVEYLLEDAGVEVIHGRASLRSGKVVINSSQSLEGDGVIVATGTNRPNFPNSIASDDIPYLERDVKTAIVVGGGAGGLEYAEILRDWGSEVYLVEKSDLLLPGSDQDLRVAATNSFRKKGIKLVLGKTVAKSNEGEVLLSDGSKLKGDVILYSFGRTPNVEGFEELSKTGPIRVDSRMYTGVDRVFAAGDVIGTYTAHEAIHEGLVAASNLVGIEREYNPAAVPKVIYVRPQIATVGRIEGKSVKINFSQLGRAVSERETEGFLKLFYEGGRINGLIVFGERAEELATLVGLAITHNITLQGIFDTIFPHPSYMEALWEAVGKALGYLRG